jgi:XTP/dITP diphosphohydrolase
VKLLVATRSAHKLEEIHEILAEVEGLELVGLVEAGVEPDPAEDDLEPYETFEENAESKARYFFERTGLPTVADDSGLEVDALDGRPGVRSKRFAPGPFEGLQRDRANNRHLLTLLDGVELEARSGRYVCALALVDGPAPARLTRGESPGRILDHEMGEGGFGYDPLFFVPELGQTFAEVPAEQKHALSHRGRAFRQLAQWLRTAGRAG